MRYFVLNTDKRWVPGAEEDMIKNKKAAAYETRAHQIDRLRENDRVFLFSNENGIIIRGTVIGKVKETEFTDNLNEEYNELNISLENFESISHNPITAKEFKNITGITPSQTLIELHDKEVGKNVWDEFSGRMK